MTRIVVGIDGSEGSARALRWAATQARLQDAELHVVSVAAFPELVGVPGAMYSVESKEEVETRIREIQDRLLDEVLGDEPGVEIRREVTMGGAAETLIDAARDADLVVVGSRGLGGFKGLLLGSVSRAVVQHASCPTVVVPNPDVA